MPEEKDKYLSVKPSDELDVELVKDAVSAT